MKTRIAVLGSTKGTDFPALIDSVKKGNYAEILIVISDKKDSGTI